MARKISSQKQRKQPEVPAPRTVLSPILLRTLLILGCVCSVFLKEQFIGWTLVPHVLGEVPRPGLGVTFARKTASLPAQGMVLS